MTENLEKTDERRPAVPAGAYINRIARMMVLRRWWVPLTAVVIICAGFVSDLRVCIAGFALLLVIYPFAMLVAVLSSTMRQEIVSRMYVAAFTVNADGQVTATDDRGADIKFCSIGDCSTVDVGRDYITLVAGGSKSDIFIVPRNLIATDDLEKILSNHCDNGQIL